MTAFVLITEGITDQAALEQILFGYYGDDDIELIPLQPARDATDEARQAGFGGWERVLEYCGFTDILREALAFNDYLIIQIDTDCCDHANFDVSRRNDDGEVKSPAELVCDVRAALLAILGVDLINEVGHRIFFAICVDSLECWLLPLHIQNRRMASQTTSCENRLSRALSRANKNYEKNYECYLSICKKYSKRADIDRNMPLNESFRLFLASLPAL